MTPLSELVEQALEQRDRELVALLQQCVADGAQVDTDLQTGNVLAARHMMVAIGFQLGQMRRLLP